MILSELGSITTSMTDNLNCPIYFRVGLLRRILTTVYGPLWSSGQSSWLQIKRSRDRFQALPDFLRSSGSGTGSIHSREDD
jgi:hypothetical protein